MDYSPWSEREIWPFLRVAVSPKPEWPRPPKLVCMHLHQSLLEWIFWANSDWLNFLMTMDYSPWSEREIWPFLRVAVSPKPESDHAHQNWCTCMLHQSILAWIFWADSIRLNFLMTMDYSPWSEREIWPFLRVPSISETEERSTPTKIGVHALDINPYLNEFFEPIPID